MGARAGFRACLTCGSRTVSRKPVKHGGKPKRPPTDRQRLRKEADTLWRQLIKVPQKCAACHKTSGVVHEAAHGFSRVFDRTRWSLLNGWDLCSGCHKWYTERPEKWTDWMIDFWHSTEFANFPADQGLALARERHQELKRLAYSSETNPVSVPEIQEIVDELKVALDNALVKSEIPTA